MSDWINQMGGLQNEITRLQRMLDRERNARLSLTFQQSGTPFVIGMCVGFVFGAGTAIWVIGVLLRGAGG